ncbi:hypothetical protein W97_03725 [Coniosporium apollinis CBS 100218]|uniref:Uncharacterized protein n=1 Tax=Coniosporium apollinis (strain CBS 100218) TaxID=1168221 RepID=R7YRL1_CONA1|nr:uncharacterized protein W97_03725 [Coniosporium apollinis CBS 100218]EON64493.1 hypothetical protein W97_03725 [Coniosporium apollinis CBS 100218]
MGRRTGRRTVEHPVNHRQVVNSGLPTRQAEKTTDTKIRVGTKSTRGRHLWFWLATRKKANALPSRVDYSASTEKCIRLMANEHGGFNTTPYNKVYFGRAELLDLLDADMDQTPNKAVAENHHLAWLFGLVCEVRPGTLGQIHRRPDHFLRWEDITISRDVSDDRKTFTVKVTFRWLKGNRDNLATMNKRLKMTIRSPTTVTQIPLSIPHRLLVILIRRGLLEHHDSFESAVFGIARPKSSRRPLELEASEAIRTAQLVKVSMDRHTMIQAFVERHADVIAAVEEGDAYQLQQVRKRIRKAALEAARINELKKPSKIFEMMQQRLAAARPNDADDGLSGDEVELDLDPDAEQDDNDAEVQAIETEIEVGNDKDNEPLPSNWSEQLQAFADLMFEPVGTTGEMRCSPCEMDPTVDEAKKNHVYEFQYDLQHHLGGGERYVMQDHQPGAASTRAQERYVTRITS